MAVSETDSKTRGALPGGWSCKRLVAEGAFAAVYEGRSPSGQTVAVKIPISENEQTIPRFMREIKVLRSMPSNPHVVEYKGHGQLTDGRPFLAMELVDGHTLEHFLRSDRPLAEPVACQLMMQLCDSLSILHVLGLSHGDIKPANIMITREDQQVKLLDFGMVRDSRGLFKAMETQRLLPGREFDAELDVGLMAGTPEYVAPEQIADARATKARQVQRGPAADVFALAVIFFRLLTGRRLWPFEPKAESLKEYQKQARVYLEARQYIDTDPDDPPPGISPRLWMLVARALRCDPELRQPDAGALKAELRRYLDAHSDVALDEPDEAPLEQVRSISGLMRFSADGGPRIEHTDVIPMEPESSGRPRWLLAGLAVGMLGLVLFFLQ
ncbi:MAG: serine/threonine protein kinase [Myxococcota bacterium]|jgi:serine/threonine protein kinase